MLNKKHNSTQPNIKHTLKIVWLKKEQKPKIQQFPKCDGSCTKQKQTDHKTILGITLTKLALQMVRAYKKKPKPQQIVSWLLWFRENKRPYYR